MRGKVFSFNSQRTGKRITPAHAGKSSIESTVTLTTGDHPRTCGEKRQYMIFLARKEGSPPHMRGKVHLYH